MLLTPYGQKEWGIAILSLLIFFAVLAVLFFFCNLPKTAVIVLAVLGVVICAGACAFFRDPPRTIPNRPDALLSPADGVIHDIELLKSESLADPQLRELFDGKDILRVGIFLSVLNVHINRTPWAMTAKFTSYKPGRYLDARNPNASRENEAMIMGGIGEYEGQPFPLAIRQVSGAIARRIVCPVKPGQQFPKGFKYGMIKFGSRTELYIPAGMGFEVAVNVGDPVNAGLSVIAFVRPEAKDKLAAWAKEKMEK